MHRIRPGVPWLFLGFFLGTFGSVALAAAPASAQEHSEAGGEAHGSPSQETHGAHGFVNEVAVFFGDTYKSDHHAFTVGVDFVHLFRNELGVGVFADGAFGEHEREYILGAGLWWFSPWHLSFLAAGGVERLQEEMEDVDGHGHGGTHKEWLALARLGVALPLHFGSEGQWSVIPSAFWDITEGPDAAVFGVGLGYLF